jgi:hypothetical protein
VLEYLKRAERFVSGSFIKQKEWVVPHEAVLLGTRSLKKSLKKV